MDILILYYSQYGTTAEMARYIARGVDSVDSVCSLIRTVPQVSENCQAVDPVVPDDGPPYVELADLESCQGLIMGTPTHFGNMAAPMKHFIDQTSGLWLKGALIGKPAGVFTSVGSMHGGHETTLTSMMLPLLHHGMLISGVPYNEAALMTTRTGGTPYGPSHTSDPEHSIALSDDEKLICRSLGKRIATIALKLAMP